MSHFHITRCFDMPYLHMSVRTLNVELLDMSEPYQLLRQPTSSWSISGGTFLALV